jgi:glycosyltransferase involved in cell wall biosynthesis
MLVDVTDTCVTPALTGIQSLTHGLVEGLAAAGVRQRLVRWSPRRRAFVPLRPRESDRFSSVAGEAKYLPLRPLLTFLQARGSSSRVPIHLHPRHAPELNGSWLLLPEVLNADEAAAMLRYAREHGVRTAAVFHDAIPVTHPHLVNAEASAAHLRYMRELCAADVVLPVSTFSAAAFAEIARREGRLLPPLRVCREAAEVAGVSRAAAAERKSSRVLCVASLDPRKNHAVLLDAFEIVCRELPESDTELHLVGDVYKPAPAAADAVVQATQRNPRIKWHGRVDREQLHALYRTCAFTVYPSLLEGFGLPVVESLWFGKPCICSDAGPMGESAIGGGCITVDVQNPPAIAAAMLMLLTNSERYRELVQQACTRPLKTWRAYAAEICDVLASVPARG